MFTLDSTLEPTGSRRWRTDADISICLESWDGLERERSLLGGPATCDHPRLRACIPAELPAGRVTAAGFRIVDETRLVEDLVGWYGQRYDLIARLRAQRVVGEVAGSR